MDVLDDFTLSPWEHEGATRAGLRSALCLAGHDWAPADAEAEALVRSAFKKLGYGAGQRPSWREGQWQYALGRDYCARCGRPMPAEMEGHRYCDVTCAKAAMEDRAFEHAYGEDEYGRDAYRIIAKSRTKPRICALPGCGKEFRVVSEQRENRFCSPACRHQSLRTREMRKCQRDGCNREFLPSLKANKYCSIACASAAGREMKYIHTCQAPNCSKVFSSALPYSKYCSGACNARAHYHRKKASAPAVHDRMCGCGRMFTPTLKNPSKITCSDCTPSPKSARRARPRVVQLTAKIFDRMFQMAA